MSSHQTVIILDFGGQYSQLIARRVRECGVYCELLPASIDLEQIQAYNPVGIIFTGGPHSVYESDAPRIAPEILSWGVPVLGICYGCQLMAFLLNSKVNPAVDASAREYGKTPTRFDINNKLFQNIPESGITWMSHGDYIETIPEGFKIIARSDTCPAAAICDESRNLYGVQFHPEVNHTEHGQDILRNFLFQICKASGDWSMGDYKSGKIRELREKIGDGKVLLALSGGVDSAVAAALLAEAVGDQLTCVFVDHGLLRMNEGEEVEQAFQKWNIHFRRVNARRRFLMWLEGVTDPEEKRKIIGKQFIRVFEEEAGRLGHMDFLAQGTIYPDVIESGAGLGNAAVIKSHHNVGGLPDVIDFQEILEPLRMLFKDEVRILGRELGLPENIINRQPFPGPGLAIRIIGKITKRKLDILRMADFIFREELEKNHINASQYFAVLTNLRSVGVMGDGRTYDYAIALRAVSTSDFMTADWVRIPYPILERVSARIVNEVPNINRVVYDITSKPPATIEYE